MTLNFNLSGVSTTIADPNTPANQVAVNNLGQIGISNFPTIQAISGTVSIAQFPSNQTVSGAVDITDRSGRLLGSVNIASGGVGTPTAPDYVVLQDGTTNGNKLAIDSSGKIGINSMPALTPTSSSATLTTVGASTSSVSILASNANRKAMYVQNDGPSAMYLAYAGTASTTAYTVKVPGNSFFEMPVGPVFTGAMSAVWDTATGNARVTELT